MYLKNENLLSKCLNLAKTIFKFGRTYRITYHDDGVTKESDTDHTVMLNIFACALASKYAPELDLGLISQFAIVHDFIEVYCGDTDTSKGLTDLERNNKKYREMLALKKLEKDYGEDFPWLIETVKKYESLDTNEAKFIKVLDKVMPKLSHILNNCKVPKLNGYDAEHKEQREMVYKLVANQKWLTNLWEDSVQEVKFLLYYNK